ncbi:hypothetical protein [Nucisporomicrobium flavum]|uniref:hypothetical protein n=1 Tax=Nucisporomicrobium flavum TaxID=2785915 RepID=UPI0018F3ECD3|nr:hypothetical protein [Nucisporomicrobium flavum]
MTATHYLQGPYRMVSASMGETPWYMVSFDRRGRCTSPRTAAEIAERAASGDFTDVILFSHGWNNDWMQATGKYESFVDGYVGQLAERPPAGRQRRTLLAGIFWPSKLLTGAEGRGPVIAGDDGGLTDPEMAQARGDVDELGLLITAEQAERLYALTQRDSLGLPEARELAELFLPLIARDGAETGESGPPDPGEIVRAWATADPPDDAVTDLGQLGYYEQPADPGSAPETAGDFSFDPREIVRALSVWQMKDRAGAVGEHGVAPLLTELLRTGIRVHCVGHSFGAKVVLSAICAADAAVAADRHVRSALLLQAAVSALSFSARVPGTDRPGGYRSALSRVELPILSTFSGKDVALTRFYHRALLRGRDLGEPDYAGDGEAPSRYAALGGFGPGGMDPHEATVVDVLDPGRSYGLGTGSPAPRVYGIRATRTIGGHGEVSNPSTWWMLRQLLDVEE